MNLNFEKFDVLIEKDRQEGTTEVMTISPLEKGYALTVGNTLRRIMLHSIPGAAVIGFQIPDVNHELMSIPGSSTDTIELSSSLKNCRFKMEGDKDVVLTLKIDEAKSYYSNDFVLPPGVELLTKDLLLLNGDGTKPFTLSIVLRKYRGYIEARKHKDLDSTYVQIDGMFSPVKKVGTNLTPVMMNDEMTHEKLELQITTDGSIEAQEVLQIAANIAQSTFSVFANAKERKSEIEIFKEKEKEINSINSTTVEELNLSVRSTNALKAHGIHTVEDLRKITKAQLEDFRNMGKTSITEVEKKLDEMKVQLGDY